MSLWFYIFSDLDHANAPATGKTCAAEDCKCQNQAHADRLSHTLWHFDVLQSLQLMHSSYVVDVSPLLAATRVPPPPAMPLHQSFWFKREPFWSRAVGGFASVFSTNAPDSSGGRMDTLWILCWLFLMRMCECQLSIPTFPRSFAFSRPWASNIPWWNGASEWSSHI